jgi:glycosyltransferase involved in cell wall biosynthesis
VNGPLLRVGFDMTACFSGSTGVARYVRQLSAALERQGVGLLRFAIGRRSHDDRTATPCVRRLRVPLRVVHRLWPILGSPSAEWLAPGCDVVHSPDLVPPPTRRPLVVTIHDLDAIERPGLHPPRAVSIQRAQLAAARDRAAVVLTVSRDTAAAIRERGIDAERVVVAPHGVTSLPPPDTSLVPDGPYLLAVGALALRKGLDVLVAAFARAQLRGVRLVLAGPDGWGTDRVLAAIERNHVIGQVIRAGSVSDAQLAGLYERCLAVCVPSLAEGFGLPVLEAAAAGVAVVASDLAVLRELDQAVALYASPGDEQSWATALERVVVDEELRRSSATRGRAFAADFSWDRTAAITLSAYKRALARASERHTEI